MPRWRPTNRSKWAKRLLELKLSSLWIDKDEFYKEVSELKIPTVELSIQDMLTVRLLLNKYVVDPSKYISPNDILPWEIGLLQVRLIDKQK